MDQAERRVLELQAEVEILRSIVCVLCARVFPDDALDAFIEDLDTPSVADNVRGRFADDAVSVLNAVADRFASKLAEGRVRKRRAG